MNQKLTEEFR